MFRNFLDASRYPPALDNRSLDEHGASQSWAMIDIQAYMADCRNATTAYGRTSNNVEIQVTFCTAPPPAVSYLCVWCPEESDVAEILSEPKIMAAETDLVILGLSHSSRSPFDHGNRDIFIYKPNIGGKRPSLHRIVCRFDNFELCHNVGILRHRNDSAPNDDHYCIVGLNPSKIPWQFKLNLYNSKTKRWSYRWISVERQHQHSQFRHSTSKVIMLGEGNLMGFVDPWRGILVCDVLASTHMHYISFPHNLKRNKKLRLNPVFARDVVAIQGRFKVVERFRGSVSRVWKASIWSRATSLDEDWNRDFTVEISDVLVDSNTLHLELLPNMQSDNDGISRQRLEGLLITHPTLSLNNDDTVYFMAKISAWDKKAWVLAVDMRNKKLLDVGVFHAERYDGVTLSYIHSRISKYFTTTPGMNVELKRGGKFLMRYPRKKQTGIFMEHDEHAPGAEVAGSVDLSMPDEPASESESGCCMDLD